MNPLFFLFWAISSTLKKALKLLVWATIGLWLTVLFSGFPGLPIKAIDHSPAVSSQANSLVESVETLLQTGIQQFQVDDFESAIAIWQQVLDLATTSETALTRTLILSNLSLAHQHLGAWETAEQYVLASLAFFENQNEAMRSPLVWDYYAKTLNTQGWLQWRQGQSEQALETWQQTTLAYQSAHNISGVVGSQLNQARILQTMGLSSQAIAQLNAVKVLLEDQPDSLIKVTGLHHLGNALRRSGDLDQSAITLEAAMTSLANVLSSNPVETELNSGYSSPIFLDLGNTKRAQWSRAVALNLRDEIEPYRTEALAHYQAAIASASTDLQSLQAQVNQLSLRIEIYQSDPQPVDSLKLTNQITSRWQNLSTRLAQMSPNREHLALQLNLANSVLSLKAKLPEDSHDFPEITWLDITAQLQDTVGKARSLRDTRSESLALGYLGHVYEQVSQQQETQEQAAQWFDAQRLTEEAIALAETIQATDIQYRWVWQLGRILQHTDQADPAPHLDMQKDQEGEMVCQHPSLCAYDLAIKLLEEVRNDLLFIQSDVQFSFRDNVEPLYREYVDLLLQNSKPNEQTLQEQTRQEQTRQEQTLRQATELIDALQLAELENFLGCNVDPTPLSEQVVDPNAAILYPVILGDRLEVILAYPDVAHSNQQRFVQFSTPVQSKEVDDLVFKFRRQLADPIVRENRRLTTASQLYDWLIRPAQEYLNSATASPIQTLVFVLDGSLQNLPMAALWDRDNEEYLLDQYAIAIAPSLQLVDPSPMTRPIKLLAAGTTESLSNPLKDGQFFTKLPGVERELEAIATVLPANVLFNETFTQESLTQEIQANEFSVIHIATHGVFSSDSARTFIAVPSADPESGKPDALFADELDVLLRDRTANQRTANRQPLELLVLSACQTAQGDNRATLGIAGLSIRAGARSTLATLWSVYDEAAATMMTEFYQQLAEFPTISRAQALQRAQMKLREHPDFKHPSYWSPYIMVGNWL